MRHTRALRVPLPRRKPSSPPAARPHDPITLFLCGDVMTGRGIDQILPHPSAPQLFEPYVSSAHEYVALAERVNGPIGRGPIDSPTDFSYVWGDALAELERLGPDARIVNLETSVTTSDDAWPGKGIHYRMHPDNVPCLTVARIDCCVLANNHTLDWGRNGLVQTLEVLRAAGMHTAGAGMDLVEAMAPARLQIPGGGRVLVFAAATADSGVSAEWNALEYRPGLWMLDELSSHAIDEIGALVRMHRVAGDIVVMSLHWGANWGYAVPAEQRGFAHGLIDSAGIDIVYGHSSHHPKAIEVYRGKPILYGCGDLLNDYEGIAGYGHYRPELGLMYFVTFGPAVGKLLELAMTPTRMRRLRVNRASHEEARWLRDMLDQEGRRFGTSVDLLPDDTLALGASKGRH